MVSFIQSWRNSQHQPQSDFWITIVILRSASNTGLWFYSPPSSRTYVGNSNGETEQVPRLQEETHREPH